MFVTGTLALPKLNLQFLTVHDYLLRNFHLFRLESTCTFSLRRSFVISETVATALLVLLIAAAPADGLVIVPRAGSGVVRMDLLRFLAGCHTRRLNQA